jgi:phosphoribosylformylglycinamidine cyclo-ligase
MRPQPIFNVMQKLGGISDREMYQIFNMGMGFCMVVRDEDAQDVVRAARGSRIVGHAIRSERINVPDLGLSYSSY